MLWMQVERRPTRTPIYKRISYGEYPRRSDSLRRSQQATSPLVQAWDHVLWRSRLRRRDGGCDFTVARCYRGSSGMLTEGVSEERIHKERSGFCKLYGYCIV